METIFVGTCVGEGKPATTVQVQEALDALGWKMVTDHGDSCFDVDVPEDVVTRLKRKGYLEVKVGEVTISAEWP